MEDNFKTIYKILSAFEKSLDIEEFDMSEISAEKLKISNTRFTKYIEMLIEAEYISGLEIRENISSVDIIPDNPHITLKV